MVRMMVDSFSAGLDDLTRKQQKDEVSVMVALSKMTRFSIFEVTANQTIANMMDDIARRKLIETTGGQYPWTTFKITEAGQRIIDDASAATQADSQKGEGDA